MIGFSKDSFALPAVPSASGPFVSIGRAATLLGVSVASLREWERTGKVRAFRTCGGSKWGQRRYSVSELKAQVLGAVDETQDGGKKIAIYARVSSQGQAKEGSLERQLGRMLVMTAERENIEQGAIRVYKDVASAFGERPALNSMVNDLLEGKIARIYVENADRLSRVPALTRLMEHLARQNHVKIVALDREDVDDVKSAMLELVEFVTVLANRTNGRKGADRQRRVLSPEALEFIRREVANGRGIRETVLAAKNAGLKTERGETISYGVARRYLNRAVATMLPVENTRNTFGEFVGKHLRPKKGSKVQAAAIHSAYKVWCRSEGIVPISTRKCSHWMREKGMGHSLNNYLWYDDIEILGYPSVFYRGGLWAREHDNGIRGEKASYNSKN